LKNNNEVIEGSKMLRASSLKAVAIVILILFTIPFALSQSSMVFGSKVQFQDPDGWQALSPFCPVPKFAFIDLNNDGIPQSNEPLYVHIIASSKVEENDVRLTPFGGHPAGSQVTAMDSDYGKDLKVFGTLIYPKAPEMRYFDVDGDGAYSLTDPVYLQFNPRAIGVGDVRITSYLGYEAGSRVVDSDEDSCKPTTILPGTLSFFNANGNINNKGDAIYDKGDVIYVDTQSPFYSVTLNDIRLSI
jgi:hypothetical protein